MIKYHSKMPRAILLAVILAAIAAGLLTACAGSAPDYSKRTRSAAAKQNNLAKWLAQDINQSASRPVAAPVCSSIAGRPSTGWAIEDNNWCVVACLNQSRGSGENNQWVQTNDGLRCFSTDKTANAIVSTEYQIQHWSLDQLALFSGFDRSFISDTEWNCKEQEYQFDPNSRRGFWVDVSAGNSYRFYNDGALMLARAGGPMKLAGDWRGQQGSGVIVNDQPMFKYAVNYGGGRFDEYRSATRKQLCRFVDHPEPRV